jgi:hypothetical protein
MNAIGAYGIVLAQEAGRKQRKARPGDDRPESGRPQGPGLRDRVRKLFGAKRVASEPGFAASSGWLDDVVPQLRSYPVAQSYR